MSVAGTVTTRFEMEAIAPFRLDLTVWALRRRPGNAVDRWDGQTYRRAFRSNGAIADLAVRQTGKPEAATLEVSVTTDGTLDRGRVQTEATARLRRMLGLEIDLGSFYRCADRDPDLGGLADRFRGLKPPRFPTLFECLANAIACQQLTLTVGIGLLNRLAATYGRRRPGDRSEFAVSLRPAISSAWIQRACVSSASAIGNRRLSLNWLSASRGESCASRTSPRSPRTRPSRRYAGCGESEDGQPNTHCCGAWAAFRFSRETTWGLGTTSSDGSAWTGHSTMKKWAGLPPAGLHTAVSCISTSCSTASSRPAGLPMGTRMVNKRRPFASKNDKCYVYI